MSDFIFDGVRPMGERDLEQVLAWRNHPEVRRYMYTQHEISLAEHTRWFNKASQDQSRHLLVFEVSGCPRGFASIHQIDVGGAADWGFYVAPEAPKGTGSALGRAVMQYAFETTGLHKLCGQALAFNDRSIRFHLRMGFQREGVLRQQHFDGQQYHDVICFGLLSSEWRQGN